jgi:hypothetical protein
MKLAIESRDMSSLSDIYSEWEEMSNDDKLEILKRVLSRTNVTEEQVVEAIGCSLDDANDDNDTIEALEGLLMDVIYTPEGATEGYTFGDDDRAREMGYKPVDEDHAMDGMWIRT